MSEYPKVTVLMSAYNAEDFLQAAVDSVLGQTFTDFEFLIFEDCSQDRTLEILRSYDDPRIRVVANEVNIGLTKNLISGMNQAKGEYVARMDADDICKPNRLERQVLYFHENPDISVVGSGVTFFDDSGFEFDAMQPEGHDEIKCKLFLGFTMLHPSVMMKKADLDRHDLNYNAEFVCSQDHDLWVRCIRVLRFANVPEALLKMREHPQKISNTRKQKQEDLANRVRQYQLDELAVEYSQEEMEAFNLVAGSGNVNCRETFLDLHHLLIKLIASNNGKQIYDQFVFELSVAKMFRNSCRELLLKKNSLGRAYWRSSLRRLDRPTFRQTMGMVFRSLSFI